MNTSEMLIVIKNMRQDWQRAIDGDTISIYKCKAGFCCWMVNKNLGSQMDFYYQLKKDLRKQQNFNGWYWYRIYEKTGRQALRPRLNHLNRTIARLENELKQEQNGTL